MDGFLKSAGFAQRNRQVQLRLEMVGLLCQRVFKASRGRLEVALSEQRDAQIIVGAGMSGLLLHRQAALRDGLLQAPLVPQGQYQIQRRQDMVRRKAQRGLIAGHRFIPAAALLKG